MMYVYLAGPISGCSYGGATDWREAVKRELANRGIMGVSPMRGKHYLLQETSIGDSYANEVLSCQKGITARDRWDCQRCDLVLANFIGAQRVSIGTVMELGWADAARRPIIVAMEEGNVHDHAMVREVAGFIVPTLEQAVQVVKAIAV